VNRWLDREVRLDGWTGRRVQLSFSTRGAGSAATYAVAPLWGNPVLDRGNPDDTRPNLILISIDCLRADHVGAYGYTRATTPAIDRFAEDGVVFETAIATSSWTHPTHMSMLTGLPVAFHGATKERQLSRTVPTLPELLSRAGYETSGVVSGPYLSQEYGFERGFRTYRDLFPASFFQVKESNRHAAARTAYAALSLVRRSRSQSQFLFLHLIDPHWPYYAPREFMERFVSPSANVAELLDQVRERTAPRNVTDAWRIVDLYDAEIAFTDEVLGVFFDQLREMDLYDSSLIVVTADHGEAFYEHGHWEHTATLFQEIVRVPLIVKWPGNSPRGRVATPVSQADIFATFLDASGIASPHRMATSLHRHLVEPEPPQTLEMMVSEIRWQSPNGIARKVALMSDGLKYIATFDVAPANEMKVRRFLQEELYDLGRDPSERTDILSRLAGAQKSFRDRLVRYLETADSFRNGRQGEAVVPSRDTLERLERLGYLDFTISAPRPQPNR
jgi:arylsulfatase